MSNKAACIAFFAALIVALATTGLWHHERETLDTLRAQVVAGELQPIATLLQENQALHRELECEPGVEKKCAILESYLAKIRRDGVAKHAYVKQRLDTLAVNNTAIVTLIKAYSPHAKTSAFAIESGQVQELRNRVARPVEFADGTFHGRRQFPGNGSSVSHGVPGGRQGGTVRPIARCLTRVEHQFSGPGGEDSV